MTEFLTSIFYDNAFYLCVTVFSGLFLTFFLVGYFISLIVRLLYKIIR